MLNPLTSRSSRPSSHPLPPDHAAAAVTATRARFAGCTVLVMPGLHGSGEDHWQSDWERRHASFRRVEQADWAQPQLDDWARRLVDQAIAAPAPIIVVAHSFGCLATVRAANYQSGLIAAALLVAPAEPRRWQVEAELAATALPFPSTLVASSNDPYMSHDSAVQWAERWGSELVTLPDAGHINVKAGFRQWSQGLDLLDALCRQARRARN